MVVKVGTQLECVCGSTFIKVHTTQKFCQDAECKRERARGRWNKWAEKDGSRELRTDYQRRFRKETHYSRKWEVKARYGLEWEDYLALLDKHNHKCALCDEADDLCVDHCHSTGVVRGILCRKCNAGIGQLGDTAEAVHAAYLYLSR